MRKRGPISKSTHSRQDWTRTEAPRSGKIKMHSSCLAARSALELHGMEARFLLPVLYHGFCCRVTKGQFIMRWLTTSFLNQYRRDRSEGGGKIFFRNR